MDTTHRGAAIVLARAYAAKTDTIYEHLRAMKKQKSEGFEVDYSLVLEFDDLGSLKKMQIDAQPEESEAVASVIQAALQNRPTQTGGATNIQLSKPPMTAGELLEDFFREGIGSGRWRNPETTRHRDYGPIWTKFMHHTEKHGLTLAAAKEYRAELSHCFGRRHSRQGFNTFQ
ncbi:MAG: hypothetical protein Q7T78_01830 [Rhodoferax sp.]|nr:hypothetical protein [Rhodoferax sp.]